MYKKSKTFIENVQGVPHKAGMLALFRHASEPVLSGASCSIKTLRSGWRLADKIELTNR
jgi:hypothetical protein